jgi:hypothetical protein
MNWIPAFSSAFLIESNVLTLLLGTPFEASKRIMVEKPISDLSAKSLAVHPKRLLAALI